MANRTDIHADALLSRTVAYLSADGCSQTQIATTLEVSQPTVSRLLSRARKEGWLITKCNLSEEQCREIRDALFERRAELVGVVERLCQATRALTPKILVLHAGEDRDALDQNRERLLAFGRRAATRVREMIGRMNFVGVAWGKTLAGVTTGLSELLPEPIRLKTPVTFVPLCGEPSDFAVSEYSASTVASSLHKLVNGGGGRADNVFSLGSTPARIPRHFTPSDQKAIRKFINESESYRTIFGGPSSLTERIDTLLTSAGTIDEARKDPWLEYLKRAENTSLHDLATCTPGDIGGVFLPHPNISRSALNRLKKINERWTGVTLRHFKECSRRAWNGDFPGVVLFASGRQKVNVVIAALQEGIVNELIVDQDLALAILERGSGGSQQPLDGQLRRIRG